MKTSFRWIAVALIAAGCGGGETTQAPSNTATHVQSPAVPLDAALQACQKKMDATLFGLVGDSAGPYDVSVTYATRGAMPKDDGRSEEIKGPTRLQYTNRDQLRDLCKSDNVQFIAHVGEIPAPSPLGDEHHGH